MKISIDNIKWSSYKDREGPFFPGVQSYELPPNPSEEEKMLAVVCSAEGGHYDAINMYDKGIVSVGLIQWIEAGQYGVSNLLGHVIDKCGIATVINALKPALDSTGSSFKKTAEGVWRFHDSNNVVIKTSDDLQKLFLGCDGLKGSWSPEAINRAKLWAASLANVWYSGGARAAQDDYTCAKIKSFVFSKAKTLLYSTGAPHSNWADALRAIYVSYAVNLPSMAEKQLLAAAQETKCDPWTENWCIFLIKQLTFGPGIGLYEQRYNSIRPVVEQIWGIKLPKTAKDLRVWVPPEASITSQVQPQQTQIEATVSFQNKPVVSSNQEEYPTKDCHLNLDKRPNNVIFLIFKKIIESFLYLVGIRKP